MLNNNLKNIQTIFVTIITLFSVFQPLQAQETVVVGQVLNSIDKSPIPLVNIYFKNSNQGVSSDNEGYFLIRNFGNQSILVFSSMGYKRSEISVKPGQSVGIQMELDEENTMLQEVFIIPGTNPALDLMKKVRLAKGMNDQTRNVTYSAKCTEQNLVLLSKINRRSTNKYLYNQLKKGAIDSADSSLVVPLYMAEIDYQLVGNKKTELLKNIFSSEKNGEKMVEKLLGDMTSNLNFYENTLTIFGKNLVSPLSNNGSIYYNFYLADSIKVSDSKQYIIHFKTKNAKNLAFNGKMYIDSATLALSNIEAELPLRANINFIHDLRISQLFTQNNNRSWSLAADELTVNMNYEILKDSLKSHPEILIKRTSSYVSSESITVSTENFAKSNYKSETLNQKLSDLNDSPLMETAKWIADVILTGYIPVGKFDVGKIQQIMRITDIEGFRATIPLRTNEKLWKNISVGGYVGYGTRNKEAKYAAFTDLKIPGTNRRVFKVAYTNDYRRVDYDYNAFMYRENPLISGDIDISNSIFRFKSQGKLSEREEFSFSYTNEWNPDIESNFILRSTKFYANNSLPMLTNEGSIASFLQQSATFYNRFSFGEKTYDDHTQRIYIQNTKPVVYCIAEVGNYNLGTTNSNYAKLIGSIKQNLPIDIGQLRYNIEAGMVFGSVPYPLLAIPAGNEGNVYSLYRFNLMNYNEFAAEKFINLHTELMLNGLFLNQIPFIKHLNLREICSFNLLYGALSNKHKSILDFPVYINPINKPYAEVGIGFTNILHFFSLQSVWRLTDTNRPGVSKWGIRSAISINF